MAWCYWFLELKLNNPDIDERKLVELALDSIIFDTNNEHNNDKNPLLSYIRGYARHLDNEKNKIMEQIGINKKEIYNLDYDESKYTLLKDYVDKYTIHHFYSGNK